MQIPATSGFTHDTAQSGAAVWAVADSADCELQTGTETKADKRLAGQDDGD